MPPPLSIKSKGERNLTQFLRTMTKHGMPLKIASSKNGYPLPWLDYEEEAVSSHGRVEALRLGRKPAGNLQIYFSIYVPQLDGWTEIQNILCQRIRVLDYCIRKKMSRIDKKQCGVWTRSNAEYRLLDCPPGHLFLFILSDWKMHNLI